MKTYTPGDYQAVCDFLVALNQKNKTYINWNWARWEWMYQHPYCDRSLLDAVGLWWDGGRVVGAALYDLFPGEVFCGTLEGHEHLLPDILDHAYRSLRDGNGLGIAVHDGDLQTQTLLSGLGYQKAEQTETVLGRRLDRPCAYTLPEGFRLREIHFPEDNLAYQTVIWKGFDHEGDAAELEKMLNNKILPPHRNPTLCLAVADEAGEFAAHCTCWYDARTDYAYVEPVCTIPKYRGLGLGKAVVSEALNRCAGLGAREAFVLSNQKFYKKLGFTPHACYTFYRKK